MHRIIIITAVLLLCVAGRTKAQDVVKIRMKTDTIQVQPPTIDEEEIELLSLDEDPGQEVTDSLPFLSIEGMEVPAHALYKLWSNENVNPYHVRLVDMPDTVVFDLSGYCHPMCNRVTSNFGQRRARYHYGIDIKLNTGDSVFCSFDGMVRIARRSRTYGYYVVVRHMNGLETTYAHLSKLLVMPNQAIKAGELVGLGGNTGRSFGAHLHYELRYLGVPINPNDIIDFGTYKPLTDFFSLSAQNFSYIKELEKVRVWTVRKGDSLGRISQKTGVSIATICRLNKISTKTVLRVGQKIRYR